MNLADRSVSSKAPLHRGSSAATEETAWSSSRSPDSVSLRRQASPRCRANRRPTRARAALAADSDQPARSARRRRSARVPVDPPAASRPADVAGSPRLRLSCGLRRRLRPQAGDVPATEPVRIWHLMTHTPGDLRLPAQPSGGRHLRDGGLRLRNPRGLDLAGACDQWAACRCCSSRLQLELLRCDRRAGRVVRSLRHASTSSSPADLASPWA